MTSTVSKLCLNVPVNTPSPVSEQMPFSSVQIPYPVFCASEQIPFSYIFNADSRTSINDKP